MCGIAGVVHPGGVGPDAELLLSRMTSILHHRGPDESGLYLDDHAGLANTRLSIIGIEGGAQPIGNEDGTLWIVFNGEIFNYVELRKELQARGHRFSTGTDTEVLVHLFEEHGPGCLDRLIGQFAFALWDSTRRELFLARDRVGIRPLFFTQVGGRFLFASEIKALLLDPAVSKTFDPVALAQVFTFWSTVGGRTLFSGVEELAPGHYLTLKDGQVRRQRYWGIPDFAPEDRWAGSMDAAVDELEALLIDAVRLRLRADVPVGAYLSGGLDSSLTTAIIAKHFNNRLRTFSMCFEEARFDETPYQDELVRRLGTEHSRIVIRNTDIARALGEVVWHCETPLVRSGPVPLFHLSRLVRESGFKVVVAGEGADEVFGGYNIFKEAKVRRFWAKQPNSNWRPRLLERLYPYVFKDPARATHFLRRFYAVSEADLMDPLFSHRVRWRNSGKNMMFLAPELLAAVEDRDLLAGIEARLPEGFGARTGLAQAQFLEMEIFLSNYLLSSQGDRVAMAHSVEGRVPFLDHRVIELAFRLPDHWKIRGLDEKHVLKRLAARYLPATIAKRPKQPYRAPIQEALRTDEGTEELLEEVSEHAVKDAALFDYSRVELLFRRIRAGGEVSEGQTQAMMGILSAQLLHRRLVREFPRDIRPRTPDRLVRRGALEEGASGTRRHTEHHRSPASTPSQEF